MDPILAGQLKIPQNGPKTSDRWTWGLEQLVVLEASYPPITHTCVTSPFQRGGEVSELVSSVRFATALILNCGKQHATAAQSKRESIKGTQRKGNPGRKLFVAQIPSVFSRSRLLYRSDGLDCSTNQTSIGLWLAFQ